MLRHPQTNNFIWGKLNCDISINFKQIANGKMIEHLHLTDFFKFFEHLVIKSLVIYDEIWAFAGNLLPLNCQKWIVKYFNFRIKWNSIMFGTMTVSITSQHNDSQHNDSQHNDTQYNNSKSRQSAF
jgi:hypothetical protein